jgi:hypothetical protein
VSYTEADLRQLLTEDIGAYIPGTVTTPSTDGGLTTTDASLKYLKEHELDGQWCYVADGGGNVTCAIQDDTGELSVSPTILVDGTNTITVATAGTFLVIIPAGKIGAAASGTCTILPDPLPCLEGATILTAADTGDFTLELSALSDTNTLTDNTGTAEGSPITLVTGNNIITVTVLGTFDIVVGSFGIAMVQEIDGGCIMSGDLTIAGSIIGGGGSGTAEAADATGTFNVQLLVFDPIALKWFLGMMYLMLTGVNIIPDESEAALIAGIQQESRRVVSFAPTTGLLTFATSFPVDLSADDAFVITPWSHLEIERALNRARQLAGIRVSDVFEASDFVWVNNTYKYSLPTAVLSDSTGTTSGSPVALGNGTNTITVTGAGDFTVVLPMGWSGAAASGGAAVTGAPVVLVPGSQTLSVTGTGTIVLTLTEVSPKECFITRIQINDSPTTVWLNLRDWHRRGDDIYFLYNHTAGMKLRLWYEYPLPELDDDTSTWDITHDQALLLITYAQIELFRAQFHRSKVDMKTEIAERIRERQEVLHERYLVAGPVPSTEIARYSI